MQEHEEQRFHSQWGEVLAAVAAGEAKSTKDALKALLRVKQGREPRIKQRSGGLVVG